MSSAASRASGFQGCDESGNIKTSSGKPLATGISLKENVGSMLQQDFKWSRLIYAVVILPMHPLDHSRKICIDRQAAFDLGPISHLTAPSSTGFSYSGSCYQQQSRSNRN